MSWFSIPKSFVAGQKAKAAEINEDFQAVADALNGLFKVDVVAASGDLALTGAYQDITGAKLDITPALPSKLLVAAFFDFEGFSALDVPNPCKGTLNLDGADQARLAILDPIINAGLEHQMFLRASTPAFYVLSLTAAAHTVKLRAKREGPSEGLKCYAANTYFAYLLIPNPEP